MVGRWESDSIIAKRMKPGPARCEKNLESRAGTVSTVALPSTVVAPFEAAASFLYFRVPVSSAVKD